MRLWLWEIVRVLVGSPDSVEPRSARFDGDTSFLGDVPVRPGASPFFVRGRRLVLSTKGCLIKMDGETAKALISITGGLQKAAVALLSTHDVRLHAAGSAFIEILHEISKLPDIVACTESARAKAAGWTIAVVHHERGVKIADIVLPKPLDTLDQFDMDDRRYEVIEVLTDPHRPHQRVRVSLVRLSNPPDGG